MAAPYQREKTVTNGVDNDQLLYANIEVARVAMKPVRHDALYMAHVVACPANWCRCTQFVHVVR